MKAPHSVSQLLGHEAHCLLLTAYCSKQCKGKHSLSLQVGIVLSVQVSTLVTLRLSAVIRA